MSPIRHALLFTAALAAAPAFAQTAAAAAPPADNMQQLRQQLLGEKRQVIATFMDLSEAEAKNFWPVYEAYQAELNKLNDRLASLIVAYANEYKAKSLTDAKARQLLDQYVAVEAAESELKRSFLPRLDKVLPGRKVARYMQLENKVRALVKYELAAEVPLAF